MNKPADSNERMLAFAGPDAPSSGVLHYLVLLGVAVPLLCGIAVLCGWAFDIAMLKSVLPGMVSMKPNAALCLILAGVSFCLLSGKVVADSSRRIAIGLAALVSLVGSLTLLQYLVQVDLGIDQILFRESPSAVGTGASVRMAPNTALAFMLSGAALMQLSRATGRSIAGAQWLALATLAIAFLALVGYWYGVESFYGIAQLTRIALHASLALLFLSIGILSARPTHGVMAIVTNEGVSGVVVRRLLPLVLIVSLLVGWLNIQAQEAELYDPNVGNALRTFIVVVIYTGVILWVGSVIRRIDFFRSSAQSDLQHTLDVLEQRVQERTLELRSANFGLETEIRERRKIERQREEYAKRLERSNRDLQDFAYVASHDLQEPLRKIQAFGDRLASRYASQLGDEGRDYIKRMQNAAERMSGLINSLLNYSRVSTQLQAYQTTDLNRVVVEVLSDMETLIDEKAARVEVDALPTVEADANQMHQLFQNLIGNALKFQGPGVTPHVQVKVLSADSEQCRIAIEDNGIGFDVKYADRIFQPFQRLHGRSAYEGTGIGLAICRKIVERHGGSIEVESTPGQGSRFIVMLPLTLDPKILE